MSNSANISASNNQQKRLGYKHKHAANSSGGGDDLLKPPAPAKTTDFMMQTQTFHRRNMSNLINMTDDEEVPDHMLISKGGPARRTLEQIEQCSGYDDAGNDSTFDKRVNATDLMGDMNTSGNEKQLMSVNTNPKVVKNQQNHQNNSQIYSNRHHPSAPATQQYIEFEHDDMELMDSQESAEENADFSENNHNSNLLQGEEHQMTIPQDGFFDMVEHPSIRDVVDDQNDDDVDDGDGDDEEESKLAEYPMTGRGTNGGQEQNSQNVRLDSGRGGTGDSSNPGFAVSSGGMVITTPGGAQSLRSPNPYDSDSKMEITELLQNSNNNNAMRAANQTQQSQQHMLQQQNIQSSATTTAFKQQDHQMLHKGGNVINLLNAPLAHHHNQNNRSQNVAHHRASPTGEISQATNESCSSLDTMGHNQQMMLNNSAAVAFSIGQHQSSAHKDRRAGGTSSPSQAYGSHYQARRPASGDLTRSANGAHHQHQLRGAANLSIGGGGEEHQQQHARMQVYQYYAGNDDEEDDDVDDVEQDDYGDDSAVHRHKQNDGLGQDDDSRMIDTTSPSPHKMMQPHGHKNNNNRDGNNKNVASGTGKEQPQYRKNKFYKELQIEIDSDEETGETPAASVPQKHLNQRQGAGHRRHQRGAPQDKVDAAAEASAQKQQSNLIQFEEVQDSVHVHDDITNENAYELYGAGVDGHLGRSTGGGDCDTPGLPREQQISSQKMLTPNEQRIHSSYFPNDTCLQRALPSTKSYQTPVTQSNQLGSSNPFMTATDGIGASGGPYVNHRGNSNSLQMVPLDTGHETNSVSTANAQYYYLKGNGQIGFGQQESQSRASDQIYEKAHMQGGGMSPGLEQDPQMQQMTLPFDNINGNYSQYGVGGATTTSAMQQLRSQSMTSNDERIEAEIRRLEELNRIDAQRLREPQTTDEESPTFDKQEAELRRLQEEETRANCPDEYNLLSATASQDNVESVEALKNTSAELVSNTHDSATLKDQQQQPQLQQQLILKPDLDLNDRESANSAGDDNGSSGQNPAYTKGGPGSYQNQQQTSANNSYRTSMTGDRASRRLYVITEESQSMAGGQTLDPSRATADFMTMKHLWSQNDKSGGHAASVGNAATSANAMQQQHPLIQQNASGYGFLKASTHSQELPLYDPSSRRLTVGSSNNTAEGRASMPYDGTPNMLDLQGSQPQQSLNQTMQVHSSPQVQTFHAYCQQDNESSNMTPDQQFISMAQINPSVDASILKDCQEANSANHMMLHQRSKSMTNQTQVANFATLNKQKNQMSQPNKHKQGGQQEITIRDDSSSPLQIFEGRHEYGDQANNGISMTAGKVHQSSSHQPKQFQSHVLVLNNQAHAVPCRSAAASTVRQSKSNAMVLEQTSSQNAGSQHHQPSGAAQLEGNSAKMSQPYNYQQLNASAHPYTGQPDQSNHALLAMQQSSHASTFQRDQDLMSAYLKQTSTHTGGERRPTQALPIVDHGKTFEFASDEDLLNSNFDRISKILPNHEQINEQLPDFHPEESVQNSARERLGAHSNSEPQTQILLTEIQQLKQTILQRNQVIVIKDNTIAELKNECGMRSSIAGLTTQQPETRDVGSLALPDTKDVKCQTHGPRKQAYYRSIPAKVQTNLPNRSPSGSFLDDNSKSNHDCSNDHGHPHSQLARYHSFQKAASKVNSFAQARAEASGSNSPGKSMNHPISNSYSPNRRRKSKSPNPAKGPGAANSNANQYDIGSLQKNEDIRSLRLQLTSLKKQLTAQEQDNMTLIYKVTALEDTIDTQEKNYDLLHNDLKERVSENAALIERNDELIKQVDSLLADNTELRQNKSVSFTSEQIQKILQERKANEQVVDMYTQTEDLPWQEFITNQLNNTKANQSQLIYGSMQQQQAIPLLIQQQNDQFSDQKQLTQRSLPHSTAKHSQLIGISTTAAQNQQQTASQHPSQHHLGIPSHQNSALGAGLFPSNHNSRVLDQLSEVMSVQQQDQQSQLITITNDQERIHLLAEKARNYEQQQARIEQEIAQYKKLLLDVQIPGAVGTNSGVVSILAATATTAIQQQPSGPSPFNIGQHNGENNNNAAQQQLHYQHQQQLYAHGHHHSGGDLLNVSDVAGNKRDILSQQQHQQLHHRQPSNISASPNDNNNNQQYHNQHQQHHGVVGQNILNIQECMNAQDYMLRSGGTMSFELNKNSSQNLQTTGLGATGTQAQQLHNALVDLNTYGTTAGVTSNQAAVGIVASQQQQAATIGYLHNKCLHQKRKLKKLQKKNQKLEFEKMQTEQTQTEMSKSMEQLNEKYRDLRAKYQLKLQEKNLKISELKNQLQQRIFSSGGVNTPLTQHTNANTTQVHSSQPPHHHHQHQNYQQQANMLHPSIQHQHQQMIGPPHNHHPQSSTQLVVAAPPQQIINSYGDLSSTIGSNYIRGGGAATNAGGANGVPPTMSQNLPQVTMTPVTGGVLSSEGRADRIAPAESHHHARPHHPKNLARTDTSQEDNKGQNKVKRQSRRQGGVVKSPPMTSSSFQNQSRTGNNNNNKTGAASTSNHFYTIVSGIVDQRIAEFKQQNSTKEPVVVKKNQQAPIEGSGSGGANNSSSTAVVQHQSNKDNQRTVAIMREYSNRRVGEIFEMDNASGVAVHPGHPSTAVDNNRSSSEEQWRPRKDRSERNQRPDLEILRDNPRSRQRRQQRHNQTQQEDHDVMIFSGSIRQNQRFVSSSSSRGNRQDDVVENYDDLNDRQNNNAPYWRNRRQDEQSSNSYERDRGAAEDERHDHQNGGGTPSPSSQLLLHGGGHQQQQQRLSKKPSHFEDQQQQDHQQRRTKTLSSSPKKKQRHHQQRSGHHQQNHQPQRETLAQSYARKVKIGGAKRSPSEKLPPHHCSSSPAHFETRIMKVNQGQQPAPNRSKKGSQSRFRSKSSEKQQRDLSMRSVLSKDDVMPCYKYKVEGRKRNQVVYQPPASLMTYLAQPDSQGQPRNMRSPGSSNSQSPPARQQVYHPQAVQNVVRQGSSQETGRRNHRQLAATGNNNTNTASAEVCEGAIGIQESSQQQQAHHDALVEARIGQMLREHQEMAAVNNTTSNNWNGRQQQINLSSSQNYY